MTKESYLEEMMKKLGFNEIRLVHDQQESDLLVGYDERSEYIRSVNTKVFGWKWNDEDDGSSEEVPSSRVLIAEVQCWLFFGGYAMNTDIDIVDQADGISQDVYSAAEMAFGCNGLIGSGDDPVLDDFSSYNALYVDRIFLEPFVRKSGLGDAILRRVIEYHDAANIAAVLMFPKTGEWNRVVETDPLFGKGDESGTRRITAHYKRLGFLPHPKSRRWLYLDMCHYDYDWRRSLLKSSETRASRGRRSTVETGKTA